MKNIKKLSITISLLPLLMTSLTSCGDYEIYKNITNDMADIELKEALHEITYHEKFISYASGPSYYKKTDGDPKNSKNIILFYTGESYEVTLASYGIGEGLINREHVWPQSRFRVYSNSSSSNDYDSIRTPTPYSDLYNVRPCGYEANESRKNYFFAEHTSSESLYDPKTDIANKEGELIGDETYRGDIARILFYDAVRYEKLELIDSTTASTYSSYQMGRLSDLLKWNLQYSVSKREKTRNDAIEGIQGNRNPFVDHPEYACRIWGSTNANTKKVCGL